MVGNKFNVVELAFKRSDRKEADCYVFRPAIPFNKLTSRYKAGVFWQTKNLHGLPYESHDTVLNQSEVIPTIRRWYANNKNITRPFLAVLNEKAVEILKKADVPFIECGGEDSYLPTSKTLVKKCREQLGWTREAECSNHITEPSESNPRLCAKEKAIYLCYWLFNNTFPAVFGINSDIDDISSAFSNLCFDEPDSFN